MKKRKELFYRVTVKEDDLVFTRSIELPAEMFSKEEALRMNNVDDEADLPNTLHWDAIVGLVYRNSSRILPHLGSSNRKTNEL